MKDKDKLIEELWNFREIVCDLGIAKRAKYEDLLEQAAQMLREDGEEADLLRTGREEVYTRLRDVCAQRDKLTQELEEARRAILYYAEMEEERNRYKEGFDTTYSALEDADAVLYELCDDNDLGDELRRAQRQVAKAFNDVNQIRQTQTPKKDPHLPSDAIDLYRSEPVGKETYDTNKCKPKTEGGE